MGFSYPTATLNWSSDGGNSLDRKTDISVIVPLLNEEDTVGQLCEALVEVITPLTPEFELIFVDDGSTDRSVERLRDKVSADARVKVIRLRGNFGKSAALAAGFDAVRGRIVFTMDADLQDDPAEIPRFLEKLDEGYDLVNGYKHNRRDPWSKVIPSRVFNRLVSLVSGVHIKDVNCGFKAYRREVLEEIKVYGEMHRLIPVLAHWRRFKIAEIEVRHHPRRHGRSHYGISRMYRGLFDALTVTFLLHFGTRPSHFIGIGAAMSGFLGFAICLYMTYLWLMNQGPIGDRPLLLLGILSILVSGQLVAMGLLSELITWTSRLSERPYGISAVLQKNIEDRVERD
jgi:glycosyltransferase involved in cell wall biosynthesis